jgi:peptide/nickel transport system permease protein
VAGLRGIAIMTRHILPRAAGPLTVNTVLMAATVLLVQTGLGFLGLGVSLPQPSWGNMVAAGGTAIWQQPWLIVPSGAVITFTILAIVTLGDAIRDATFDARSATAAKRASGPNGSRRKPDHSDKALSAPPADVGSEPEPEPTGLMRVRGLAVELPLKSGWARVVDDVGFEVGVGETVGLVGESGCGKSVTAMALLGLVPGGGVIAAGEVLFAGLRLTGIADRTWRQVRGRRIALIAQDPMTSLDPSYTVRNQLVEAIRSHRAQPRRVALAKALELLAMTGIADPVGVATAYPHQLSGGLAQRVGIARALAGDPELLIADEPTTALDSTVQREILVVLRRIQLATGMAVILVSHDWGVVAETCDRAIVMYAGQVVESADTARLITAPTHPYTRALLAANPHLVARGQRIQTIEGRVPPPGEWPTGCRFAARCPVAEPACRAGPIALVELPDGRVSRCLRLASKTPKVIPDVR